ncbi:MAG: hypothetical protein AB8B63_22495 [Granulosicoccus sp.]
MTRRSVAFTAITLLCAMLFADFSMTKPNPYKQPAIIALGSGASSSGGFCGALPD